MGCFSSKITTNSTSSHEDFNRTSTINTAARKPDGSKNPSTFKHPNSNSNIASKEPEKDIIETINAWELLPNLEQEKDYKGKEHRINGNDSVGDSRSLKHEKFDTKEGDVTSDEKGTKRKAMAKELPALEVPFIEFKKIGSLRDWLVQGGPGSYMTPKFGNFVPTQNDNDNVFHPELVAHFEKAMEQSTKEEEIHLG